MSRYLLAARAAVTRAFATSSLAISTAAALSTPTASAATTPDAHAPIGVTGDHIHQKGEVMFSYRYMHMSMQGNKDGDDHLSPERIATAEPNRFFGRPMQPPTLRVVPTEMSMDMHMLGAMYAPSDRVTLMLMGNYIEKEMEHITFMGATGTQQLGTFTTKTSGFGDTQLTALVGLADNWHLTAGVSLPTGDYRETDQILTPMNTTSEPRLPYPMQLGSGTYDPIIGLTYANHSGQWGWGGQWRSLWRVEDNDADYRLGDEHQLTTWSSYRATDTLSISVRLAYVDRENIDSMDGAIVAPVQTADPGNWGKKQLDGSIGVNLLLPGSAHRLAVELKVPIYQDLNGPQLETDWVMTLGWQYTP